MSWKRVTREFPCPICGKPDWCLVSADGSAAICARVQSPKPCGRSSAGWLHLLSNEPVSRWRTVERSKPRRPISEIQAVHRQCLKDCTVGHLERLASNLGLSLQSLIEVRVGYNVAKGCWSFPMRDEAGRVVGLRYRAASGKKWSEVGSREGLFYRPDFLTNTLVIVEGASDTAALLTIACRSCIGRASCTGNVEQLLSICRSHQFRRVVIVPDADAAGWTGSRRLAERLSAAGINPDFLNLPAGIKDCRQCIAKKENADWLRDQIGKLFSQSLPGATSNDCTQL
jgi:5S rRNA maturation endonuclease (ribonuclease M5)